MFYGWIDSTWNALLILEVARKGIVPRVIRRFHDNRTWSAAVSIVSRNQTFLLSIMCIVRACVNCVWSLCVHAFGHWCCDFLICASSRQWERENSILLSKSSKICRDSDQWSDENLDLRELERKYLSQTPLKGDTVPHKGCTSTGITQLTIAKNVYHKLPTTFRSQRIPSYISQWRRKTQYQSYQRFGWTNCAYQL